MVVNQQDDHDNNTLSFKISSLYNDEKLKSISELNDHDKDLRSRLMIQQFSRHSRRFSGFLNSKSAAESFTGVMGSVMDANDNVIDVRGSFIRGECSLNEEELNDIVQFFEKNDDNSKKSMSRMLVESYLQHYDWYFPSRKYGLSLEEAWALFENAILPRRKKFEGDGRRLSYVGESCATDLYDFRKTPERELDQWGIAIFLYFSTLRVTGWIFLVIGLLNIVNIYYFFNIYAQDQGNQLECMTFDNLSYFVKFVPFLYGSAVCTNEQWMPCSDCTSYQWSDNPENFGRNSDFVFVKRNMCNIDRILIVGLVNYASFFLLVISFAVLFYLQNKEHENVDEANQTSQDYSIEILNPPKNAYDPEDWKRFFDIYSVSSKPITLCTIVLDNHNLIEALIKRRMLCMKLNSLIPGIDLSNKKFRTDAVHNNTSVKKSKVRSLLYCCLKWFHVCLDEYDLLRKIEEIEAKIHKMLQKKYNVTRVFLTFESEESKRNALACLTTSKFNVFWNKTRNVNSRTLFFDRVLHLRESEEPFSIRYLDLCIRLRIKLLKGLLYNVLLLLLIVLDAFIIKQAYDQGPFFGSVVSTILNSSMIYVSFYLTELESHPFQQSYEISLFIKTTLFKWVNYGIIPTCVTPFTKSLTSCSHCLLPRVVAIFISNLVILPALRLLNLKSNFKMHYLAPRAKTQREMDLYFSGTEYNLAERYSDLTTALYLCFFYSALFPIGFFFTALTCFVTYYTDKFCLLRIWSQCPPIGFYLTRICRKYFFSIAFVAFSIHSAYLWSGFPFDNTCIDEDRINQTIYGNYTIQSNGEEKDIYVFPNASWVIFCNQNFYSMKPFKFPPLSKHQGSSNWMTPQQELLTSIYGWTSVVVLIIFILLLFGRNMYNTINLFRGKYMLPQRYKNIDFSEAKSYAYIPQIKDPNFTFPLLACNIDHVDEHLIGWKDHFNKYDIHNLIYDVPHKGLKRRRIHENSDRFRENLNFSLANDHQVELSTCPEQPVFSYVKYWPPPRSKPKLY